MKQELVLILVLIVGITGCNLQKTGVLVVTQPTDGLGNQIDGIKITVKRKSGGKKEVKLDNGFKKRVKPGNYQLKVTKEGYEIWKKEITVIAEEKTIINPKLRSKIKLTIWQPPGAPAKFMQKKAVEYAAKTGVQVAVEEVQPLKQEEKLRRERNKGADIVVLPHDQIGVLAEEGLLWPLPQNKIDSSRYVKTAVEGMSYEGNLYGLPYAIETLALFYNQSLVSKIPDTMQELFKQTVRHNDPANDRYGFLYPLSDFYYSYPLLKGYGAYIFDNEEGKLRISDKGLTNKGAIKGVKYIHENYYNKGFIKASPEVMREYFMKGKTAVCISGPWAVNTYNQSGINYGIAPMPKLDNGEYPRTFVGIKGYYVNAYSNQKEAALKFINWLTNKQNNKEQAEEASIIPAHKGIKKLPNAKLKPFLIQAKRGVPMPNIPAMNRVWGAMNSALAEILDKWRVNQLEINRELSEAVNKIKLRK